MDRIGLIAGNRKFPLLFAKAAKKNNCPVVAVAIRGETSPMLKGLVEKIYWLKLTEFSRLFTLFKQEGITKVVMAGQVSPKMLFSKSVNNNQELKKILNSIKDKKADTIFGAIASRLKDEGLSLLDSTTFLEDYLPKKGILTKKNPGPEEWLDINFGMELAKAVAGLDIGQTVAVRNQAVVAVEALEGTDNLIRRAGKIGRSNLTIVKVSKPKQDLRFDVPVIGLNTVKNLIKSGAKCLAIEAGKTLFIDKEESLKLADRRGIVIAAV